MQVKTLRKSIEEAHRFIAAAQCVEIKKVNGYAFTEEYCKQSSACKRASLDLTRTLADLRQNR